MSRILSAPGIYEVSQSKHGVQLDPDWRYFAFFRLLQISPSYWLAHQQARGGRSRSQPTDSDTVAETYRMFGEVWSRPYWDWWFDVGQFQFGTERPPAVVELAITEARADPTSALEAISPRVEFHYLRELRRVGLPATILLSVPLSGNKKALLRQIGALLDHAQARVAAPRTSAPFQTLRNKVRDKTVDKAIRAVQAKAEYPTETLFALGVRAKLSPTYARDAKKEEMSQLVSRHLLQAYRLAENAARGDFPSLDELPDEVGRPSFDYARLQDQQRAYARLSSMALSEIPVELRTNEHRFAGPNRTIQYDDGPMKHYQIPW